MKPPLVKAGQGRDADDLWGDMKLPLTFLAIFLLIFLVCWFSEPRSLPQ